MNKLYISLSNYPCVHPLSKKALSKPNSLLYLTQVTRDYDEEEQGYDSEKERAAKDSDESGSSPARYEGDGEANSAKHTPKQAKQNGDDHNEEQDMDVSD